MSEGDDCAGPEKKLIEALREFIIQEAAAKEPKESTQLSLADAAWLMMALVCVALVLYLIPEEWLKSEGWKFFLDKLLPWFLNVGALAAVVKSPDSVLAATRNTKFKWSIGCVLLLLILFAVPVFRLEPTVLGDSTVYVDGRTSESGKFPLAFRPHEAELRPTGASKLPPRRFQIGAGDLLGSIFHGFVLRPPTWRAVSEATVNVSDDGSWDICVKPNDFEFDEDFLKYGRAESQNLDQHFAEYTYSGPGALVRNLPNGAYSIGGFKEGCGAIAPSPLSLGPNLPGTTSLKKAQCTPGATDLHPKCSDLFPQEVSK